MDIPSTYLTQKLSEQRTLECTRRAERYCALEKAGVDQRGWLTLGACRLVSALGCALVALGKRLERVNRPSVAPSAGLPHTSGA